MYALIVHPRRGMVGVLQAARPVPDARGSALTASAEHGCGVCAPVVSRTGLTG